ncbi:MAG: hypothetical protein NC339_02515 [Muribaculaceae bacterium]|nr:hypothetical protein [Muribaculaceae bacterium]
MPTPFEQAREAWNSASSMRATRRMLKLFTYGRQWDAILSGADSTTPLSNYEEYCLRNNRRPLTNNLLRSLVKSVVGRFRLNLADEHPKPGSAELALRESNRLDELDARALEEFLISGCAIQRVVIERRFEGQKVWVDNVNPSRFFCNRFLDPRGTDLRLVGMLHDMSLPELCLRFGHGSRRRHRDLAAIFAHSTPRSTVTELATAADDVTFHYPSERSLCRVVEVWTFEIDKRRGPVWKCRFYSADGTLIDETLSPFAHRSHPFVLNFYPLTDGEVHPFIEDVIDQQRHINLLISSIDQILSHSAKGVLLFPTDALPPGVSISEAATMWGKPGGVIPVNPSARRMPEEISASGRSEGASGLLDIELRLFQQISGVTNALQGQAPSGTTSASLYESQVQNSAVALLDIFETFNSFRRQRTLKALSLMNE